MPWLESIVRDTGIGVRMLRKNAIVTGAAVLSLSLALGACAAAFSLVDALIFRPLPVQAPGDLVYLTVPTSNPDRPESDTFNDPTFVRLRDAGRGYVNLFAMSTQVVRPARFADAGGEKEEVRAQHVSGDAFDRLGVGVAAGRRLTEQDDVRIGAHPVAVISHAFWMRRFAGDPSVIGRWFALDEQQLQIVGVSQQSFTGIEPGRPTDVWLPYTMYNRRSFGNFEHSWFRIIGRLRNDVRIDQAQTVLQATFTNIRRERAPRLRGQTPEAVARFIATPLYLRSATTGPSPLRQQFQRPLWILISIAVLVLLIAGSNVANLFLARTAAREREMALRVSIGAGRARLVQQVLIESAIISFAACALALLFALWAAPTVVSMLAPPDDPVRLDLGVRWQLLAFLAGLTMLTTALFGLAPALRASAVAPIAVLKSGGRTGSRAASMRPFVALQVAFAVAVLFVGGLLVVSFVRLSTVNPGFDASRVLVLSLDQVRRVESPVQRATLLHMLEQIRGIPGVEAASSAESSPIGRAWTHNFRIPGTETDTVDATMQPVTHGYFETMGIPLVEGRGLVGADMDPAGSSAIVVNQAFAARFFSQNAFVSQSPYVGRTVDGRFGEGTALSQIVGVVEDTRYDLRKPAAPTVCIPLTARNSSTILVRSAGDPMALAPRLRDEIRAASSSLFRVSSMKLQSAVVSQTLLRERLLAILCGFFAAVGLTLVVVGLYGVLSYSVIERTREIGIRIALGANVRGIAMTVVGGAAGATAIGALGGLAGGLYLSRFLESLLFEVAPLDFWNLVLPLASFIAAMSLAAAIPAVRAARVDPAITLRWD